MGTTHMIFYMSIHSFIVTTEQNPTRKYPHTKQYILHTTYTTCYYNRKQYRRTTTTTTTHPSSCNKYIYIYIGIQNREHSAVTVAKNSPNSRKVGKLFTTIYNKNIHKHPTH